MKILTETDKKYEEIELHVCNNALTDEVRAIVGELHEIYDSNISGTDEKGNKRLLRRAEILSAYSEGQRVIVLTGDGRYSVQQKLYELESELGDTDIRKIRSLDMSITGTIKLVLKTGYETYVSRRNVAKIKEKLTKVRSEERA